MTRKKWDGGMEAVHVLFFQMLFNFYFSIQVERNSLVFVLSCCVQSALQKCSALLKPPFSYFVLNVPLVTNCLFRFQQYDMIPNSHRFFQSAVCFVCNSETHDTIFFLGRVKLQCKKYRMLARQWYRLVVIISLFLAARRKLSVSMTMVKHMYKFSVYLIWKEKHSR